MARSPIRRNRFENGFPNRFQSFGQNTPPPLPQATDFGQSQLPPVFGGGDQQQFPSAPLENFTPQSQNFQQPSFIPPPQAGFIEPAGKPIDRPAGDTAPFIPPQAQPFVQRPLPPQNIIPGVDPNNSQNFNFSPQGRPFQPPVLPQAGAAKFPGIGPTVTPPQAGLPAQGLPKFPGIGPTTGQGPQGQLQGGGLGLTQGTDIQFDPSILQPRGNQQPNLQQLLGTAFGGGNPFAGLVQETPQFAAPPQITPEQLLGSLNLPQQAQAPQVHQAPQIPPNLAAALQQFRGGNGNFNGINSRFGERRDIF